MLYMILAFNQYLTQKTIHLLTVMVKLSFNKLWLGHLIYTSENNVQTNKKSNKIFNYFFTNKNMNSGYL